MLKPLIQAIPSKILTIEGKRYPVYEMVNISFRRVGPYQCQRLLVSIYGVLKQKTVRVFPGIIDPVERTRTIHLYIEDIVNYLNGFVEKNYRGDFIRYSDLKKRFSLEKGGRNGLYTYVKCYHYTEPGNPPIRLIASIGHAKKITQSDIDAKVKETATRQLEMNLRYNQLLAAKHRVFRDLVEQQIAERNASI